MKTLGAVSVDFDDSAVADIAGTPAAPLLLLRLVVRRVCRMVGLDLVADSGDDFGPLGSEFCCMGGGGMLMFELDPGAVVPNERSYTTICDSAYMSSSSLLPPLAANDADALVPMLCC
jgi:hypothetical protein